MKDTTNIRRIPLARWLWQTRAIGIGVAVSSLFGCDTRTAVAEVKVASVKTLPPPALGQASLWDSLRRRSSSRDFSPKPLDDQTVSNLLWAANGVNRPANGGRTAPSAYDWRYADLYLADATGYSRYNPAKHALERLGTRDIRGLTGKQDFVATAPLTVIIVMDEGKMDRTEAAGMQALFSGVTAGAVAQNIYLYCSSAGLNVVVRASLDRGPLHKELGLGANQKVIVAQTIGYPPGTP